MKARRQLTTALVFFLTAGLVASPAVRAAPSGPLSVPPEANAEYAKWLAAAWARLRPQLEDAITQTVAAQTGQQHGALKVDRLKVASMDLSTPPSLEVTPVVTGVKKFLFFSWGTPRYDGERVAVSIPGKGKGYRLELDGHLTYDLNQKVLFFTIKKTFSQDVRLVVENLRATDSFELDTSDPAWPKVKATGELKLDFDYSVRTSAWWQNALLVVTKPIVTLILKNQLSKALAQADGVLATLKGKPQTAVWGAGAPGRAAFAQAVDLEKAALAFSDQIQASHVPFGTVVNAKMSDPVFGRGTPTGYEGYGDSAIWTGHYLAGESFRWAVTKDPRAQANARKALEGIRDLLDVEKPGDGYLARFLCPTSHPDAATFSGPDVFTTTLRGQTYVCGEDISRDQYFGAMHGLATALDFLDDPATKALAGTLIRRIVDRLAQDGWCGMRHDRKTPSAPFFQSPDKMVMFSALAAKTDPRYATMRQELGRLAYLQWFTGWTSTLDPLNSYYKWNLGFGTMFHALRLETDPGRYQALARAHAIDRRTIGHHENAYFQTIDVAVEASLKPSLAPLVEDELRRWTARPHRGARVKNSTDPSIAQDWFTAPLSLQLSGGGANPFTGAITLAPKKELLAKFPIPVEKRTTSDFIWQRCCFDLDGDEDPHLQAPGVDLVLPYWMARYYGVVK